MNLYLAVPDNCCQNKGENGVNNSKQKFQTNNVGEMFFQQKIVLGNITVVIVRDSDIEQNIQQQRKIEQCEIHSVSMVTHKVLYITVDTKNPERFNKQVQGKQ